VPALRAFCLTHGVMHGSTHRSGIPAEASPTGPHWPPFGVVAEPGRADTGATSGRPATTHVPGARDVRTREPAGRRVLEPAGHRPQ
jgi:hypothetical protein